MVKVLKAGFFDTIQDLGRFGYQQYGVPISGVMDIYSAKLANALLNNEQDASVLEITMTGPTLQFNLNTLICVSGADMSPLLNSTPIKMNFVVKVCKGDVLSFGKLNYGIRSYLAASGGFQTEQVFGSRSMYQHITKQEKLYVNDVLKISEKYAADNTSNASLKVNEQHFKVITIEVFKGPEFDLLSDHEKKMLLKKEFTISKNNNRMAYQLEEDFDNSLNAIITSLVLPGTVQLTPSGKLIILMRDCQTTGGYPRIFQLKEASINSLAQKNVGKTIRFKLLPDL